MAGIAFDGTRSPHTKYWGLAALVGLPLGYGLIFGGPDWALPIGGAMIIAGFCGYVMTLKSTYATHKARKAFPDLDEREQSVVARANGYAFRALGIAVLLALVYAAIASQPERATLWFPRDRHEWVGVILPLALILPMLPSIIAEWLDPAPKGDDS